MTNQRNISLDILRIIACSGVITIHTAGSVAYHGWAEPGSLHWIMSETLDALSRWTVPVFAMLTGFIFLNPEKPLPLSKLYGKYIARIAIALVVWSIFYALTLHKEYYPFGIQEGHFWYLGMCIGLYMALPIMRIIAANEKVLRYFCWVWLACKVYFFVGNFVTLPFDISYLIFTDYVGYSLWAYYLYTLPRTKNLTISMALVAIVGVVSTVIAYLVSKNPQTCWGAYASPSVIATAQGIFFLFSHYEAHIGERMRKGVQFCSECTFGIYLIHMWLLIQMFFRIHRFVESPIMVVLICIPAVFIIGWLITAFIKQIPVVKKWIV